MALPSMNGSCLGTSALQESALSSSAVTTLAVASLMGSVTDVRRFW